MKKLITNKFVVLLTCVMILASFQKSSIGKDTPIAEREKMPKFLYYTLDGKNFSHNELNSNQRYLFVYFNPQCDICQEETEEIISNIGLLEGVQIVMVSPSAVEEVKTFVKNYELEKHEQIVVLHDPMDVFYKEFGANGYPNVYLYNEKKELIMYFDEAVSIEEMKEWYEDDVLAHRKNKKETLN